MLHRGYVFGWILAICHTQTAYVNKERGWPIRGYGEVAESDSEAMMKPKPAVSSDALSAWC